MFRFIALILLIIPALIYSADRTVLSILPFENTSGRPEAAWMARGLSDMLTTGITASRDVIVVERSSLQKVIDEQKLSMSGMVDETKAVELGKLLNAQFILTGSYIDSGSSIRIDARLINTKTGAVKGIKAAGSSESIFDLVDELSGKVFVELSVPIPPQLQYRPAAFDAVKNFYQGMDYLESGKAGEALAKFELSAKADPLYLPAQRGLEDAYKFLKDFKKLRFQRELRELYQKLEAYRKRLGEKPFRTYAEIVMSPEWQKISMEERTRWNNENLVYLNAGTPAQCVWNMQLTLFEIRDKNDEIIDSRQEEREKRYEEKEKALDKKYKEEYARLKEEDKRKSRDIYGEIRIREEQERDALRKEKDEMDRLEEQEEKDSAAMAAPLLREIVRLAGSARKALPNDEFLPEILYLELLAYNQLEDYPALEKGCEDFMLAYPSFRMVEFVESFYERALEKRNH